MNINKIVQILGLENELQSLSLKEFQMLDNPIDENLDTLVFVRIRTKPEVIYPNKKEVPLRDNLFINVFSLEYISKVAKEKNYTFEVLSNEKSVIGLVKLSKKHVVKEDLSPKKSKKNIKNQEV